VISTVVVKGYVRKTLQSVSSMSGFSSGVSLTRAKMDKTFKTLLESGAFSSVSIRPLDDPAQQDSVIVEIVVEEKGP